MGRSPQQERPKARLPKGFRDVEAQEIHGLKAMLRHFLDFRFATVTRRTEFAVMR